MTINIKKPCSEINIRYESAEVLFCLFLPLLKSLICRQSLNEKDAIINTTFFNFDFYI